MRPKGLAGRPRRHAGTLRSYGNYIVYYIFSPISFTVTGLGGWGRTLPSSSLYTPCMYIECIYVLYRPCIRPK